MKRRHWVLLILLFSLIGIGISTYDVIHPWGEEGSFCDFSSVWSCSAVNTCKWARLFNVKVAVYGLVGYSALFLGALFLLLRGMNYLVRKLLVLAAVAGFIFSLYLTGIELFVLHTLCPTCVLSQLSMAVILLSVWFLYTGEEREEMMAKARRPKGILVVVAVLVGGLLAVHAAYALCGIIHVDDNGGHSEGQLDEFARCLTESGAVMYGKYNCGYCNSQKESFRESWQYVTYVECGIEGQPYFQTEECRNARIDRYPTWKFSDGSQVIGAPSFSVLAAKTGCQLPEGLAS